MTGVQTCALPILFFLLPNCSGAIDLASSALVIVILPIHATWMTPPNSSVGRLTLHSLASTYSTWERIFFMPSVAACSLQLHSFCITAIHIFLWCSTEALSFRDCFVLFVCVFYLEGDEITDIVSDMIAVIWTLLMMAQNNKPSSPLHGCYHYPNWQQKTPTPPCCCSSQRQHFTWSCQIWFK